MDKGTSINAKLPFLNEKNIVRSVTGAKQSSSSGIIIENKFLDLVL